MKGIKHLNFKPLLLTIPFLITIVVLFVIDDPVAAGKDAEDSSELVYSIGSNREASSMDTAATGKNTGKKEDTGDDYFKYRTLHLVIGKVGSVERGGAAVIFTDPDEASEPLGYLQFNCAVEASEEQSEEDWVQVKLYGEDTSGYVKRNEVEEHDLKVGCGDPTRDGIVKTALEYIGLKFVRYGKSLDNGIDCSNFLSQIFEKYDVSIPTRPVKQFEAGLVIDEKDAQPGDIIYYDKANDGTGHVALYLGDGFMINSSGHSGKTYPQGGVRICRLLYHDRDHYLVVNILDTGGKDGQ